MIPLKVCELKSEIHLNCYLSRSMWVVKLEGGGYWPASQKIQFGKIYRDQNYSIFNLF